MELNVYVLVASFRCTQIKTYSWDNAQVVLVGNKCDMEDERVISFERGKQLADSLGLEFFETSAKENVNVRVSLYYTYFSFIHIIIYLAGVSTNGDNSFVFFVLGCV